MLSGPLRRRRPLQGLPWPFWTDFDGPAATHLGPMGSLAPAPRSIFPLLEENGVISQVNTQNIQLTLNSHKQ